MAYGDFKDLPRRAAVHRVLHDKAKNLKYDRYQRGLASMVYRFFDKKLRVVLLKMKSCRIKN